MLAEMFKLETIDGNNLFKKQNKRQEKESKRKIKNRRMVLSW